MSLSSLSAHENAEQPYILIFTDSLGFPRSEPEMVRYEETYVALLKVNFPDYDFIHVGRGGATIVDLYKHTNYFHGTIKPALVLIQCGIVDCAPRALKLVEQQIISRVPVFGSLIGRIVKRYAKSIRRWRKISYTPLSIFVEYKNRFELIFPNIYWIEILPAVDEYETSIDGISKNIRQYNEVLARGNSICTNDFSGEQIMSDYHHLNTDGHRKMFEKISCLIYSQISR
ncbi:SGNH/GDSL hydrolase family protein [Chromobacterium haemolyticum]|uniref:SGNH/GDSL hydrolase family protein n=1 Tax=Chromobacterium haemolyticum TaxID=394935 RepID=UPI001131FF51|nr:SGNH/GDSL hydrolase family protein [Chromobacterium haemolyticum]